MNCEDFNKIIHELADYKPMQVTLRDAGVSHVALCADCATKLASARILSTSLVVAAGAESEAAPARIKENLLAAFTAVHGTVAPPKVEQVGKVDIAEMSMVERSVVDISMGRRRRWWTAAAVAVAAVILLAVIVPSWRTAPEPESIAVFKDLPAFKDLKAGLTDRSRPSEGIADRPVTSSGNENPSATKKAGPGRRRLVRQRNTESGNAKGSYETVAENTGEYLPLTYLAKSTAIDSGTIVRVELSRSALASLGIRTSLDGTGKSVKADVVIGDDGVAQAIRLVQ
jgi:hypothetical protein